MSLRGRLRRVASPLVVALIGLGATAAAFAAPDGLSGRDEAVLKQQLADAVQKEEWTRLADLVPQLARKNDKKTWELLVRVVERAPAGTDCASALRVAAQAMDGRGVQDAVKRTAVESRSVDIRRQLVLYLVARQDWPTVLELIGDGDEQVAAAAAWGLVEAKVETSVEPLLALMERLDRDRAGIWDVLRDGLGELLGARLASAAEVRARWEEVKQAGGLAAAPALAPRPVEIAAEDRVIEGTRIVFILDVSGSMAEVDPEPEARDGGILEPRPAGMTRLQRATRELRRVLTSLPETTRVNIIVYSTPGFSRLWRLDDGAPTVHAMTERNKRDACEFLERMQPDGTSAADMALARAFEVEGARCFYLVAGGVATHDGMTPLPTTELLAVISEKGKDRRVTVHTLGFRGAEREMLIEVARHTGGSYSDIR